MDGSSKQILPKPKHSGAVSLEEVLTRRRTVRRFQKTPLEERLLAQLLWSMQGFVINEEKKQSHHRTSPSAGGVYPLEEYLLKQDGFFVYKPEEHSLDMINSADLRGDLSIAASTGINQQAIADAPLTIVLAMRNESASQLSPIWEDALRYVYLETGHATQNLILQAYALDLGVCTITSYKMGKVYEVLKIPLNHRPIYILPIGYPQD